MKIERTTIAAAACGRAFAWRKVLRASSPLRLTDLSSLFVGILRAPKFISGRERFNPTKAGQTGKVIL
jgi:hypothetical protein